MIILLYVANTYKDPAVLAYYFLKEIEVIRESITKLRGDCGLEIGMCVKHRLSIVEYGKLTSNKV